LRIFNTENEDPQGEIGGIFAQRWCDCSLFSKMPKELQEIQWKALMKDMEAQTENGTKPCDEIPNWKNEKLDWCWKAVRHFILG